MLADARRRLNPDVRPRAKATCATVRIARPFDAVLIHDAIDYMTSRPTCGWP